MQCLLSLPPSSSVLLSSLHSPAKPGFIFQFSSLQALPSHSLCHLSLSFPRFYHVCIWPLPRSSILQMSLENIIMFIIKLRNTKWFPNRYNAAYFFVPVLSDSFLVVFNAFTFIAFWKKVFLCLVLKSPATAFIAKATKFVTITLARDIFFSCHCVYH